MEDDNDSYVYPKLGKVHFSPSMKAFGDPSKHLRIASKVMGESDGASHIVESGTPQAGRGWP